MKNSHFSTPRTLAECQFVVGYATKPYTRVTFRSFISGTAVTSILVGTAVILYIIGRSLSGFV